MREWLPFIISMFIGIIYFILFPNITAIVVVPFSYYLASLLIPPKKVILYPYIDSLVEEQFECALNQFELYENKVGAGTPENVLNIVLTVRKLIEDQYGKELTFEESEKLIEAIELANESLKKHSNVQTNYNRITNVISEIRKVSNE